MESANPNDLSSQCTTMDKSPERLNTLDVVIDEVEIFSSRRAAFLFVGITIYQWACF